MARAFKHTRGQYVARFEDDERALLVGLLTQTRLVLAPRTELTGDPFADLVASLSAPDAPQPDIADEDRDAALERLLPSGVRGDDEESRALAAEFRRFTEEGLRQRKVAAIDRAVEALAGTHEGDRVALDHDQAVALTVALTDVRLLIAERMGMRTDEDSTRLHTALDQDPEHPLGYPMAVYDFLTWLQETLTGALMGRRHLP